MTSNGMLNRGGPQAHTLETFNPLLKFGQRRGGSIDLYETITDLLEGLLHCIPEVPARGVQLHDRPRCRHRRGSSTIPLPSPTTTSRTKHLHQARILSSRALCYITSPMCESCNLIDYPRSPLIVTASHLPPSSPPSSGTMRASTASAISKSSTT
jgi:hypothetical protein